MNTQEPYFCEACGQPLYSHEEVAGHVCPAEFKFASERDQSFRTIPLAPEPTPVSERALLLEQAAALTTGPRNATYGDPTWNMGNFAALVSTYLLTHHGVELTLRPHDGANIMVLAKLARTASPGYHADNYIDAAAYAAMAGECRKKESE